MHKIELLAPARTADIGIEAFSHGADAVYIGSPAFGARAAASNTVADIERLAQFGHRYNAKTIVAMNTILTDSELPQAERLAWQLYDAGVDALIIQDLGLLQMNLPPIELHASTQTDNRTIEKTRLLRDMGMTRVVMARELSVDQITAIHQAVPDVELECFIHGALCVCISGQCYLSAALSGRSANRGECAQPCRLPMDLLNADGNRVVAQQRHLLSLRDMNRSAYIEQLIDAGVTSLKIEGRLKDVTYVKNVVAYYRQLIDNLIARRDDYRPLSEGRCYYTFTPCLEKSFNRGFTAYFANGEREPMWNFDSPKSMGELVGNIIKVNRDSFVISSKHKLNNGDGLVVGANGFRLNRIDTSTNTCYPLDGLKVCQTLHKGDTVFRNLDTAFEQQLSKPSAKRKIPISVQFVANDVQMKLRVSDSNQGIELTENGSFPLAERDQTDNIIKQLSKLGDTVFEVAEIEVEGGNYFIPSSKIADFRRKAISELEKAREKMQTELRKSFCAPDYANLLKGLTAAGILPSTFLANVLNEKARKTYADLGINNVDNAFEIQAAKEGIVMQTKHCLKYAFGQCPKYHNPSPEKLTDSTLKIGSEMQLKIGNRKFILKFGCKNDCVSKLFTIFAPQKM